MCKTGRCVEEGGEGEKKGVADGLSCNSKMENSWRWCWFGEMAGSVDGRVSNEKLEVG